MNFRRQVDNISREGGGKNLYKIFTYKFKIMNRQDIIASLWGQLKQGR